MIDWKLILLINVLPAAIGVGVTWLVGSRTNDFINKIANPIQATVSNISNGVKPLSADIHALREAIDQLANPLGEVAITLKEVAQELRKKP